LTGNRCRKAHAEEIAFIVLLTRESAPLRVPRRVNKHDIAIAVNLTDHDNPPRAIQDRSRQRRLGGKTLNFLSDLIDDSIARSTMGAIEGAVDSLCQFAGPLPAALSMTRRIRRSQWGPTSAPK